MNKLTTNPFSIRKMSIYISLSRQFPHLCPEEIKKKEGRERKKERKERKKRDVKRKREKNEKK